MIEIILTSESKQKFNINLNNFTYSIEILYNNRTGIWSLSLSENNEKLLESLNLIGGVNLLENYNLSLSNLFIVNLSENDDPDFNNLSINCKLVILNDQELVDVGAV